MAAQIREAAGRSAVAVKAPNSAANFWPLNWANITNMAVVIHSRSLSGGVFREPHAVVTGTVKEVIAEADGDHHVWLQLDDDPKSRFTCEFIPELPLQPPPVGTHGEFFGIFRWDDQHGWFEVHPVTFWRST
jgi:hypothetical protein